MQPLTIARYRQTWWLGCNSASVRVPELAVVRVMVKTDSRLPSSFRSRLRFRYAGCQPLQDLSQDPRRIPGPGTHGCRIGRRIGDRMLGIGSRRDSLRELGLGTELGTGNCREKRTQQRRGAGRTGAADPRQRNEPRCSDLSRKATRLGEKQPKMAVPRPSCWAWRDLQPPKPRKPPPPRTSRGWRRRHGHTASTSMWPAVQEARARDCALRLLRGVRSCALVSAHMGCGVCRRPRVLTGFPV